MPPKRSGLGRGLDALIPRVSESESLSQPQVIDSSNELLSSVVKSIPIDKIQPNPRQPRTRFDANELNELAESIRQHGIIQPLIIKRGNGDDTYILIAGERRLQAAKIAGIDVVPAIIREASDQELIEIALIENVQRADLSPLETAEAYRQLAEEFSLSHEEIAKRVGKSRVAITNTLRLLKLPSSIQAALAEGSITEGHARALIALPTPQSQIAALHTILSKSLNVRQTEELVRRLTALSAEEKQTSAHSKTSPPELKDIEEKFRSKFNTRVDLLKRNKGGTITFHFYSDEELNELIHMLLGDI